MRINKFKLSIINVTEERNMKTYQSTEKKKKKNFFRRHARALIIAASSVVVAVAVILSVVLTLPDRKPVADPPVDVPPVDVKPTIVMPVSSAASQTGLEFALDKLVYWDTLEVWKYHPGIDFVGDSDVMAIRDGTVTSVDMHTTLDGNVVTVTHDDGYVSVYKSLGDNVTVKVGDKVKAGDKLGTTSSSMASESNTGAHLHLEIQKDGKYIDPSEVLPINQDK